MALTKRDARLIRSQIREHIRRPFSRHIVAGVQARRNPKTLVFATYASRFCSRMCESEDMDWQTVASQFLRALRGNRSQSAFSRRLRYRSNVACDWEAGRRFPTATRTILACDLLRLPVDTAFQSFQPACLPALRHGRTPTMGHWLDTLRGNTTVVTLSQRTGFSRYAIARWLSGQAEPRLPAFLQLVEEITGRVSDLVQALVPIEQVPTLVITHRRRAAAKRLAFDLPWTEAVLRVIETVEYQRAPSHRPGYIARRLRISESEEEEAVRRLEEAGILRQKGGRYTDIQPLTVDTTASVEDLQKLKAHWTTVCLERISRPLPDDWLGYNVVSVSESDLEQVRTVMRRAFREIRAMAAASQPIETVALLNMQLISWPDPVK
jgi:transcriptional regulator with XRE-family HTH domain